MIFVDQRYTKKQEAKGIKKGVSIYLGMNYLLFICFRSGYFLMHFLTKSRTEACTTLLWNYYRFLHKREEIKKFRIFIISIQFLCIINSVHLYELLMGLTIVFAILFKKGTQILKFSYLIVLKACGNISTDKLDRKRPKVSISKI